MSFAEIVTHWFAWGFFLSEWAIRLVMLVVVPFRRTPAAAKGWLLLIFFQPWIGLLLYALIGRPTMPRSRVEQMAKLPQVMAKVRERVLNHPSSSIPSSRQDWSGRATWPKSWVACQRLGETPLRSWWITMRSLLGWWQTSTRPGTMSICCTTSLCTMLRQLQ
jgi:phospholipase D-like protein